MSTRRTKRERQRVQAPRSRPSPTRRRQASPRVLLAAFGVLLAAGLAIGLAVAFAGSSGSSRSGSTPKRGSTSGKLALPQAASVERLFAGIRQRGNVLGASSAPVTMIEFVDLQCPYCDQFDLQVLPDIVGRYVRAGRLQIKVDILAFIGPDSERGRLAAVAAGAQNRMFDFIELLYANQGVENTGWLTDSMVVRAAASIPGLDVPLLLRDGASSRTRAAASAFDLAATRAGVRRTPTILVGRSGVSPHLVALRSPTDETSLVEAIDAATKAGS